MSWQAGHATITSVIWVLFIVVAVLIIGAFAALAAGRLGYDPMAPATTTQRDPGLAEHFTAADVTDLHFDTALRGYRMDQVDEVLDRLQDRIAEQEREIEALRGKPVDEQTLDGDTPSGDAPRRDTATDAGA